MSFLTVSVVITNWQRQRCIPRMVDQLAHQSYPKNKYEVVVVDDDSDDKKEVYKIFEDLYSKHEDMRFRFFETHRQITLNPCLRYNIGARNAEGDVILLNESDVLQIGEYLQRVNDNHLGDENLFLGPELIHIHGDGREEIESFRGPCDLGGSVRRKHYHAVRGFNEITKGWGSIESEFANRLQAIGVHYRKDPELKAYHLAVEHCGIPVSHPSFIPKAALPFHYYGSYPPFANTERWGTLDTLEEIELERGD